MDKQAYWKRFQKYLYTDDKIGFYLDVSRMYFHEDIFANMGEQLDQAFCAMDGLEEGAKVNVDEQRMAGHYWLRAAKLAPEKEITEAIDREIAAVKEFSLKILQGKILSCGKSAFRNLLLIGVGGSALGPQLITDALLDKKKSLQPFFIDNTDPDGIDRIISNIGGELKDTLVIVVSKSGRTVETCNGLQEIRQIFSAEGIDFSANAVMISTAGSELDKLARSEGWLKRFYIWDWVGGRTSVFSAVGLLPAALAGVDIDLFLAGARDMDESTRVKTARNNPSALLALMWYQATSGCGSKNMVIIPYKDQLQYIPRYMQQLIMESLGKKHSLQQKTVHQGINVYGNKGSTDQHAYVQQLVMGLDNNFVIFIEVLSDWRQDMRIVKKEMGSGDYLRAFMLGTREALTRNKRGSITISLRKLDAYSLGALIAVFERAVGFYAFMVGVNAYDQPGVEQGKKSADMIIDMLAETKKYLKAHPKVWSTLEEIALAVNRPQEIENLYKILEYVVYDGKHGIKKSKKGYIYDM